MYEPRTTNAQTEPVVRAAGGHHKIPFFSLSSSPPSSSSPFPTITSPAKPQRTQPAHAAQKLLCTEGQLTLFGDKQMLGLSTRAIPSCLPMGKDASIWCGVDSSHICFSFCCNPSQPLIFFPELTWKQGSAKIKQLVSISPLLSWLRAAASCYKQCLGNKYLCFQPSCLQ